MKVLYFGIYDPNYSRNRVLIKGLKKNGVEIQELRRKPTRLSLVKLFFDYLRLRPSFDIMIVGFPGQEVMFLARFLTRKPVIFDTFTSHYGGYILDRKKYSPNSIQAKYYKLIDRWSCKLADRCLLDTQEHINFFSERLGVPKDKFLKVFVGTDSDIFYPKVIPKDNDKFLIHFHGHFVPLQGAEYIVKAIGLLKNEDIIFQIIGRGQEYRKAKDIADQQNLNNIVWIDSVAYEDLPNYINKADICLGGFGDTEKTKHVSMNKLFEYMACGKPIITGDSPAGREFLKDG